MKIGDFFVIHKRRTTGFEAQTLGKGRLRCHHTIQGNAQPTSLQF